MDMLLEVWRVKLKPDTSGMLDHFLQGHACVYVFVCLLSAPGACALLEEI